MSRVICVTNRKGGVGKTLIATHLAAGLAAWGLRVGLIDTDSQAHAGIAFDIEGTDGLYNVLIHDQDLASQIVEVPAERFWSETPAQGRLVLLPGGWNTYRIPHELEQHESFKFMEMVDELVERLGLDVVIIDTNPTMSMFDGAVYMAADGFLYVTECEALAFEGLHAALEQAGNFARTRRRYLNRETRILGIVPNKMRASTLLHRKNIEDLVAVHGRFDRGGLVMHPVMLRTVISEAGNLREPVFVYAPASDESNELLRVVQQVREGIERWHEIKTV